MAIRDTRHPDLREAAWRLDFYDPGFLDDPYPALGRVREATPTFAYPHPEAGHQGVHLSLGDRAGTSGSTSRCTYLMEAKGIEPTTS